MQRIAGPCGYVRGGGAVLLGRLLVQEAAYSAAPFGDCRGQRGREPVVELARGPAGGSRAQLGEFDGRRTGGGGRCQAALQERAEHIRVAQEVRRALGGVGDLCGDGEGSAGAVGMPAGGGDGGDETEREHVARRGDFVARALLGGHELRGADEAATARQTGGIGGTGDAEVDDPRPVGAEEDVARLEVAVHHSRRVHGIQGAGDAGDQLERGHHRQRTVDVDGLVEGHSGHVRGGEPRLFALRVMVDHRHQVVPADLLSRLDLLLEPAPELAVAGVLTPDHLECDGLVAPGPGKVHRPHAALPDPGQQPVSGQFPRFL